MIKVENLIKKYDNRIVLSINDLTIQKGQIIGLVGNNGAGKTTFLRAILDLIQLDNGSITLNGILNTTSDAWKKDTSSYLGDSFLIPFLKAEEHFEFVASTYNIALGSLNEIYEKFHKFFDDEILNQKKYIKKFSLGNKTKIGIAAALMAKPKILLLDEPFSNLDPRSQITLINLIKELVIEEQTTVIVSSHDLNHIVNICDRVILLEKGLLKKDINTEKFDELRDYFYK